MTVDSILLEIDSMIANAEAVKQLVLNRLVQDKLITEEQQDHYMEDWQVIVFKKGWFKRWCDKYSKGDDTQWMYKFVKFQNSYER